ncbi:MAG: invasion associated locus B family protein [Hyphomicrobiales bacterium]|nr:invasion associated locus B family protein [Hyphomicrobiales bacterium]
MLLNREHSDRPLRHVLCSAATAVAFLGLVAGGAMAQQSDQPAGAPAAGAEEAKGTAWIKLCTTDEETKKEQCLVTQELRDGNSGELLASGSVRIAADQKTLLIFAVPIGVLLPPGVRIQIDNDKPTVAPYTICFPQACVVRMEVDDAFVANMKRGSQMTVSVLNAERKALGFPLTLVGFTKAYDGPPLDPELYKQAQQKLTEEIKRRAEEARQKQEQQQGQQPQ